MLDKVANRRKAIYEYLTATPDSIAGIAEHFSVSYHTIRRDVDELEKQSLVYQTGRNAQPLRAEYATRKPSMLPEFRIKLTRQETNLAALSNTWVNENFAEPGSVARIRDFRGIPIELMEVCRALSTGEISKTQAQAELSEIRKRLAQTMQIVESSLDLMQQFVDYKNLWNADDIDDMRNDVRFDDVTVRDNFEALLRWKADQ